MRRRSWGVPATMSSRGISRAARASAAARSSTENVGSSKSRCWGSLRTNPTEFARPVTRLRACWFAEYPVVRIASLTACNASGDTQCPPLITRDTVPRETPAAAATSRIVGRLLVDSWLTRSPLGSPAAREGPGRHVPARSLTSVPSRGGGQLDIVHVDPRPRGGIGVEAQLRLAGGHRDAVDRDLGPRARADRQVEDPLSAAVALNVHLGGVLAPAVQHPRGKAIGTVREAGDGLIGGGLVGGVLPVHQLEPADDRRILREDGRGVVRGGAPDGPAGGCAGPPVGLEVAVHDVVDRLGDVAEHVERVEGLAVPVEQRLVVPRVGEQAGVVVVLLAGLGAPVRTGHGQPRGLPPVSY